MDGTSVVALVILMMFIWSFPSKSARTAATQPVKQTTNGTYAPVYSDEASKPAEPQEQPKPQAVEQPVFPVEATPTTAEFVDKSPAPYQYVSYDRMQAIIRKYNKNLAQPDVDRIKIAVDTYCKEKDIDPRLILAIMARESSFNPNAVSPSGAIGLGQIMPFNYEKLGINDPHNIDQNTKGVVYYMKQKLDDWKTDSNQVPLALASYLKGTGDIKRGGGVIEGHAEVYVNDILKIRSGI